jgi:hypothetical protein
MDNPLRARLFIGALTKAGLYWTASLKNRHVDRIGTMTTPLARIASGIVLTAVMAVSGGEMAAASGAGGITLRYRCAMPLFPEQPMTVRLTWNAPKSVPVGKKTPVVPFDAVATMSGAVTQGLAAIGAVTVEGTATATGAVAAPGDSRPVSVPLAVPRTPVPPSGSITVPANGRTPELVFQRPGHATVTVGREFTVSLVPRTADGGTTFIGDVDASCALEPGQDTVLTSFDITAPPKAPAPGPGRPTGPAATEGPGTTGTQKAPEAPEAPETTGTPGTTGKAGPVASPTAGTPSSTTNSEISATGGTSTTAAHDAAFTTVSAKGLAKVAAPWLAAGAILVAGTVFGCVFWLRRRHRRGRHHPGAL